VCVCVCVCVSGCVCECVCGCVGSRVLKSVYWSTTEFCMLRKTSCQYRFKVVRNTCVERGILGVYRVSDLIRQQTSVRSAYTSIHQHTPLYVNTRQNTSALISWLSDILTYYILWLEYFIVPNSSSYYMCGYLLPFKTDVSNHYYWGFLGFTHYCSVECRTLGSGWLKFSMNFRTRSRNVLYFLSCGIITNRND
jgi:hypothetical protein